MHFKRVDLWILKYFTPSLHMKRKDKEIVEYKRQTIKMTINQALKNDIHKKRILKRIDLLVML